MNKICFLVMLFAVVSLQGVVSEAGDHYGYQKYGEETLDSVEGSGMVMLDHTKVLGVVEVNGRLKGDDATIGTLQVNGEVDLHRCVIIDTAKVNGGLIAEHTTFQKALSVASQKVILHMCTVDSLTIRKLSGYTGKQVVDLRNGTRVRGPIVVESGNGEIWISSDSKISEVSGAEVIKK